MLTFAVPLRALRNAALGATVLLFAVLTALDAGLHTAAAPNGIVSYEVAGSESGAVLASWNDSQRRDALLVQGLDYALLCAYATLLASVALEVGTRSRRPRVAGLARLFAWAGALSGVADAIENVPLILMLRSGTASELGSAVALLFASLKFALIALTMTYAAVAWWFAREDSARLPES